MPETIAEGTIRTLTFSRIKNGKTWLVEQDQVRKNNAKGKGTWQWQGKPRYIKEQDPAPPDPKKDPPSIPPAPPKEDPPPSPGDEIEIGL